MPDDDAGWSPSTSTAALGSISAPTSSTAASGNKRIAKACEPCRIRRTRCDGEQPCRKCVGAGGLVCTYRNKARPSRRPRLIRPFSLAHSQAVEGEAGSLQGLRAVEASLERQYEERTGISISLALPDADTHPALALDTPLPLLPTVPDAVLTTLCDTFVREVLAFFHFLSAERLQQLVQRQRDMPSTVTSDQLALLYAVYAMGYLRQASTRQETVGAGPVPIDPELARLDIAYFRHALELVQMPASATALQALHVLQLFALSTASIRTSRQVLSKLCWGVQELGLHKQSTANAYPAEFGTTEILFMAVWNDVYIAGLTGYPPFLRDVDMDLLTETAETGGIVAPAMGQLVLLEADLLREAHANPARLRDPSFVLAHDAKLFAFLKEFGSQTEDYTNMSSSFAQTHYHFQRLLLRAPSSTDPVLGPSSLAILSRSAVHLLRHYERIFLTTRHNNCVWSVLLRVVGAGHAILQALWHGDMVRIEAEDAMARVLWLLEKLGTRWTVAAAAAYRNFAALMAALELDLPATSTPSATHSGQHASPHLSSAAALPLLPSPPPLPAHPVPPDASVNYGAFFDLAAPSNADGGEGAGALGEMPDFWGAAGLAGQGAVEEAFLGPAWWRA